MAQSIEGVIIQILKAESGVSKSGSEWKKQEFVIETQETYPKNICFTLFKDKISILNQLTEGMEVTVHYNLESRNVNGRWFHSINCWKIEGKATGSQTTGAPNNYQSAVQASGLPPSEMATQDPIDDEETGLPF